MAGKSASLKTESYLQNQNTGFIDLDINIGELVKLPKDFNGNDLIIDKEWIAYHSTGIFINTSLINDLIREQCEKECTSGLSGPPDGRNFIYHKDRNPSQGQGQAPGHRPLGASFEIQSSLLQIESIIFDKSIYPTKAYDDFPQDFKDKAKIVFTNLFQILAHFYHAHFGYFVKINFHKYLNTVFAHLVLLNNEFRDDLIDGADLATLKNLIQSVRNEDQKIVKSIQRKFGAARVTQQQRNPSSNQNIQGQTSPPRSRSNERQNLRNSSRSPTSSRENINQKKRSSSGSKDNLGSPPRSRSNERQNLRNSSRSPTSSRDNSRDGNQNRG